MGNGGSKVKAKGPAITERDRATLEVKVQRDRLKQYQKKLALVTQRETDIAREHYAKGNRPLALLALKKRNFQQGLLDKTVGQLLNLEEMVHSIEFAAVQVEVVAGLRQGNQILNQLREEIRIEDVELLMENTAEAIAYQNEISSMLSGQNLAADGAGIVFDEDELLQELNELVEPEKQKVYDELARMPSPSATRRPASPAPLKAPEPENLDRKPVMMAE